MTAPTNLHNPRNPQKSAVQTSIQWTDFTINFWIGCFKVDEECKYCYMYRDFARLGRNPREVRLVSQKTIDKKLKAANALATLRRNIGDPTPVKIFLSSWTDVFLEEADAHRPGLWELIRQNPQLTFQVLTKRPERIAANLPADWGTGYPNVWLGTSVGHQAGMRRLDALCKVPAVIRFLSAEPLLGPIYIKPYLSPCSERCHQYEIHDEVYDCYNHNPGRPLIQWVIIGGESGNDHGKYTYRQCELPWIKDIIHQCRSVSNSSPRAESRGDGPAIFLKQLGTWLSKKYHLSDRHGGDMNEWPVDLHIREFPTTNPINS